MKINGFTLIELIIAIGLSAIFIPAIVYVYSFSLGSAGQGEDYTKAYALAQESMEAVYYLKENESRWDWNTYPANGSYYLTKNGGIWTLNNIDSYPEDIDGDGYIVSVEIADRDDGSDHFETRFVTVNVLWQEKTGPTEINLVSYISKH